MQQPGIIRKLSNVCSLFVLLGCLVCACESVQSVWRRASHLSQSTEQPIAEVDSLKLILDSLRYGQTKKPRPLNQRRAKKVEKLEDDRLSLYDSLYRAYAKPIGWDWHLLAAISYVESRFKPDVVSKRGATGLMQLMPRTAENYGCPDSLLLDPEENIKAGSALLFDLETRIRGRLAKIKTHENISFEKIDTALQNRINKDLVYFTIAGFHAGLGHIYDAIVMADSLGYDATMWEDNVEECLRLKADSTYYNLPYVRLGRYNGKITSTYIREVLDYYDSFKKSVR